MAAIAWTLLASYAVLTVLVLIESLRLRRFVRGLWQLAVLGLAYFLTVILSQAPTLSWRRQMAFLNPGQDFGSGENAWPMIVLIFVCVVLGMAARYYFYLRRPFSWAGLLKPLCASPIVLLPLLGTLQDPAKLEAIQVVSFCLLAFQNGFFWKVVFERAQKNLEG